MKKSFIKAIKPINTIILGISVVLLMVLPIVDAYVSHAWLPELQARMYDVSLWAVFLVMSIRPLADLFPRAWWLRAMVPLRKGVGVFSAAIIVSFILSNILAFGPSYFLQYLTLSFWSFSNFSFFAHLGDVTAIILLLTSNNFALRILKRSWKGVQRLSYVYFYAGATYVLLAVGHVSAFFMMLVVWGLVTAAFIKSDYQKKKACAAQASSVE